MTRTPPSTPHPADPRPFGGGWNWRVVGMLALFTAVIAGSVIAADIFARRDRSLTQASASTSNP